MADDVITFDENVIFATRDTWSGHSPMNLRITDTVSALFNGLINNQWQLPLGPKESLVGKIKLVHLKSDYFAVIFVVYDGQGFYLCYHCVNFIDFMSGINTIVSHQVPVDKGIELTDVIYEPHANVMVILTNGETHSEIYHVNPFVTTNDYAYMLEYENGNLYSIDTVGDGYFSSNADAYVAVGAGEYFHQDISGGYTIERSCLPISRKKSKLRRTPIIGNLYFDLLPDIDTKQYQLILGTATQSYGVQTCMDEY